MFLADDNAAGRAAMEAAVEEGQDDYMTGVASIRVLETAEDDEALFRAGAAFLDRTSAQTAPGGYAMALEDLS